MDWLFSFCLCNCCFLLPTLAICSAASSYTAGLKSLSANDSAIVGDSVEGVTENSTSKYLIIGLKEILIYFYLLDKINILLNVMKTI